MKKSDELNDACRTFFERLKIWLKEQETEVFYAKEVRSAFRLSPSSLKRYLYELERMGYIKITRGNRYKGFEYKVQSWNDLETLKGNADKLLAEVLHQIKSVVRSPAVAQSTNGLHNRQKSSAIEAVVHSK